MPQSYFFAAAGEAFWQIIKKLIKITLIGTNLRNHSNEDAMCIIIAIFATLSRNVFNDTMTDFFS